jgi:hypothetical protein
MPHYSIMGTQLSVSIVNDHGNQKVIARGCDHKEVIDSAFNEVPEINRRLKISQKNRTHGMKSTRLYATWESMKRRCNNPNAKSYKHYGGRGICVCGQWNRFEAFAQWAVENGYSDELTIERIDTDGNYEPSNCCWKTQKDQQNNRRNNHRIAINGVTKTLSQWAESSGINPKTILSRINYGWRDEDLLRPVNRGIKYNKV